jgi:hypothetical protein
MMGYTWAEAQKVALSSHRVGTGTDQNVITIDVDRFDNIGLRLEGTKAELCAFVVRLAAHIDSLNEDE